MLIDPKILCKRCIAKVEASRGRPGRKAKLDLNAVRELFAAGWSSKRIADEFRVGGATVARAKKKLLLKGSEHGTDGL